MLLYPYEFLGYLIEFFGLVNKLLFQALVDLVVDEDEE